MAEGTHPIRLARCAMAALGITTALAGCATTPMAAPVRQVPQPLLPSTTARPPGDCHASGSGFDVLPDPACTPGAINPQVTQANIASTICSRGWTATVRPPVSVTEPLKRASMVAYGERGPIGAYQEDHLVALGAGGSPSDPRNLWAEPGATPNPKDAVEVAANRAICSRLLTLTQVQAAMATDWIALGRQLGVGG